MSTILEDPKRRIVPRWRLWREAVRLGDIDAFAEQRIPLKPNLQDLAKAKFDWETHRSLPFAGDFIGIAFALGQGTLAKEAAEFILRSPSITSKAARELASLILAGENLADKTLADPPLTSPETSRRRIQELRKSLHEFPRSPLTYVDLAREYVALGQPLAALKPIQIALTLAPNSRFVLRSAARFFLHFNDSERAHEILRRAEFVKTDPWLVAAEIAVASAAGRTSSLVKIGREFVESKKFHPLHISELASALGTLEWENGNIRFVKRLFRRALERPTENAVAQAGWVSRRVGDLGVDARALQTPRSYEASAWANITSSHWTDSLTAAKLWLGDEPFAKRPAVFGSWVALTTASDFRAAEGLARYGLITHPNEFLLLNNLAVSLAYQGKPGEALYSFDKIGQVGAESPYRPTYLATKGLIQFRLGAADEGRRLYRMAVSESKNKKDTRSAIWALLHFAREEFRCDPSKADSLIKEALVDFQKLSEVEQAISARILELVLHPTDLEGTK